MEKHKEAHGPVQSSDKDGVFSSKHLYLIFVDSCLF